MIITVRLARRSLAWDDKASNESAFKEWVAFAAKGLGALDVPPVAVSALPADRDQKDRVEGASPGDAEKIEAAIERLWAEWRDQPRPSKRPPTYNVVVWNEWQTHVYPIGQSVADPDLLLPDLERARKAHAGAEIVLSSMKCAPVATVTEYVAARRLAEGKGMS